MASVRNGLSVGAVNGARTAADIHAQGMNESPSGNKGLSSPSSTATSRQWASPRTPPNRSLRENAAGYYEKATRNQEAANNSDEDIPENMYLPDKDDPEGWIHRDKLAKIESEELQAAGINLANARAKTQKRSKPLAQPAQTADESPEAGHEDKRQRVKSPVDEENEPGEEKEDKEERFNWDFRTPAEIAADTTASQIYNNPSLRKSGSKIPIMTGSPAPIPAERYERDKPIARKRTASGTMSFDGDSLNVAKARAPFTGTRAIEDEDEDSSNAVSSKSDSPQKYRSKSTAVASPSTQAAKKASPGVRKASAPLQSTSSPAQRPGTRSGEQDRPRTSHKTPEGDPPWLATMYKPDPRLPPDQQLIPTLAKKQAQAQWAEANAAAMTYDREFTPMGTLSPEYMQKEPPQHMFMQSSSATDDPAKDAADNAWPLKPMNSPRPTTSRPGTAGSVTAGYSTMPRVTSPPLREQSPKIGPGTTPAVNGRSTAAPAPTRMQATSLATEDDEKHQKKGCGCCVVM